MDSCPPTCSRRQAATLRPLGEAIIDYANRLASVEGECAAEVGSTRRRLDLQAFTRWDMANQAAELNMSGNSGKIRCQGALRAGRYTIPTMYESTESASVCRRSTQWAVHVIYC